MNVNKKNVGLILIVVIALTALSYIFDRDRDFKSENIIDEQEILNTDDSEIGTKEENNQPSGDNKTNTANVLPGNKSETKTENKEVRTPRTFVGKIYAIPKDGGELSKFDDYILLDDGKKYGLEARKDVSSDEMNKIIDEVIVSYRDAGRIAEIKGVLVVPADDVGGGRILVEYIKEVTN